MYTRVFETILDSSLNVQSVPPSARWLWITMLIIADRARTGIVDMPIERLAARAGLTLDQANEGLALLAAPDKDSRSDAEEGRRIVPIREDSTRGWRLVNYEDYAKIIRAEHEREQVRLRVAAFRERAKAKSDSVTLSNDEKRLGNGAYESESADEVRVGSFENKRTVGAKRKTRTPIDSSDFAQMWNEYPSQTGKAKALVSFGKSVLGQKDSDDIREALRRYKKHLAANPWKHPQNGSTWFNNWREWVDFVEPIGGSGSSRAGAGNISRKIVTVAPPGGGR
jgi:hypothetical protein